MSNEYENEYEDDFLSYHSDFDLSSSHNSAPEASNETQQITKPTGNAHTVPENITIPQGAVVFSQAPMDYRKKCIEGIYKEQFVRTLQQFVSRGTSTYRVTETINRGVQVPSLLSNSGFDQGGIALAESLMTIALTGQIKSADTEDLPVQVRNKSILKNLNMMKERLICQGTRETKIGFLMEQCVALSEGFIALIAVKLLEEELEESRPSQEEICYPLTRTHIYQFLLVSCDLSLAITHVYIGRSGMQQRMPVGFTILPREQDIPPRIVLFSQLIKQEINTIQPKKPYPSDSVSILTVPLLEGFAEILYRPADNFSPPIERLTYRVAHRLAKNIVVVGLTEHGLLYSWMYDELSCEVSVSLVMPSTGGIAALSVHTIAFSSQPRDKSMIIHMTNGAFLVVQFMPHQALASEVKRLLEICLAVSTVTPGTALDQNIYYNPMHATIRSVRRIPHVTVKLASALCNGITCIQYTDGAVECFGSAINERIAVCSLRKDGLSVLLGSISDDTAERIYKDLQD